MSERYEVVDQGHRVKIVCPDGSVECFDPSTVGVPNLDDVAAGAIRQLFADIAERDARIESLLSMAETNYAALCRAEAELARLREQEPVATVCLITDRFAHNHCIETQLQVDPSAQLPIGTKLYAEPMPATKESK